MNPRRLPVRTIGVGMWMLVVFLMGLHLRLDATWQGLPYLYPWDESALTEHVTRMLEQGDPNPRFFNYPSLPLYGYAIADLAYLGPRAADHGRLAPGSREWLETDRDTWNTPRTRAARNHRTVTAYVGALTCALAVAFGAAAGLPLAGAATGIALAFSPLAIAESAHADVDAWMALFALATLVPLVSPAPGLGARRIAAVLAGLAIACKYTGAFVLLPVLWAPPPAKRWKLAAIAFVSFAIAAPFVLLDPVTAAHQIGYELVHYSVRGHAGQSDGRGIDNLLFYARTLGNAIGPVAWLAIPGAAWLWARWARLRPAIGFGVLYLAVMALQRVAFARNVDVLFPIVGIAALGAFEAFARATRHTWAWIAAWLIVGATFLERHMAMWNAAGAWEVADSRIRAMSLVATRWPAEPGAVDRALHVHGEDLARVRAWRVTGADTAAALLANGAVKWALLADSAAAPAHGVFPVVRFGAGALGEGPPRDPALKVWARDTTMVGARGSALH